jgi:predicted transcriptional regulator
MQTKPTTSEECRFLAEYRLEVLGLRQADIATAARCRQAWISHIEAGHLPAPWKRNAILKAYRIAESEFVRLVGASWGAHVQPQPAVEIYLSFSQSIGIVKFIHLG